MKIVSMGDGIFDGTQAEVEGKPCIVLIANSRDELRAALDGIGLRDDVTVVKSATFVRIDDDGANKPLFPPGTTITEATAVPFPATGCAGWTSAAAEPSSPSSGAK